MPPGTYDAQWFSRIFRLNARVPFQFRVGNYSEAKREFYRHVAPEPRFQINNLRYEDVAELQYELSSLREDIVHSSNTEEVVKQLYLDKLHEKEQQFELIRLAMRQLVHGETHTEAITTIVESVYGKPTNAVFNQLRQHLARAYLAMGFPIIRSQHYKNLRDIFTDVPESSVKPFEPVMPADKDDDETFHNASDVREKVVEYLKRLDLNDWSVRISNAKAAGFMVLPRTKKIVIPNSRVLRTRKGERALTERTLEAILSHEVGTHAVRAHNGMRSPLQLLWIGLANYWSGEEGVAALRQLRIMGSNDYAGANAYFALGIAYGLDRGGRKRNFYETFRILHDYFYVFFGYSGINSKQKAFVTCSRIFNGATGQETAFIMTKDVAYRHGHIALEEILKTTPEAEKWFDIGKYDPANEVHTKALRSLGLIA